MRSEAFDSVRLAAFTGVRRSRGVREAFTKRSRGVRDAFGMRVGKAGVRKRLKAFGSVRKRSKAFENAWLVSDFCGLGLAIG